MKEEHKSEIIHDALNLLDDDMIEEVERLRGSVVAEKNIVQEEKLETTSQKEIRPWRKWVALAASVCVLIVVGGVWNASLGKGIFDLDIGNLAGEELKENSMNQEAADKEDMMDDILSDQIGLPETETEKVTIPANKVSLKKEHGVASDMLGLFIYKGRCYVQTCDYMTIDVIGDYVCTSTGLIDEWTTKDGYVELAGSIEAKFYEVKGINPEFMLCTVYENGVVEAFVHNNGITLGKGSELLVDRLGLDENYKQISYFTGDEEWENQYQSKLPPTVVSEEHREIFDKLIDSFNESDFVLTKNTPINKNGVNDADARYHLYITTQEGVPLHFMLLRYGYISFYGLDQVCVKVDLEVYEQVLHILEDK